MVKEVFQQNLLGQVDIHMQKNEFGSLPHNIWKINLNGSKAWM